MALNNLVAGECGGANPLMKLTEQVQSGNLAQRNADQYQQNKNYNALHGSTEVMIPQTFNMQNLLDEMQDLHRPPGMAEVKHINSAAKDWQKEFMKSNNAVTTRQEAKFHADRNVLRQHPIGGNSMQPFYNPIYRHPAPINNYNWAHDYLDESIKITENSDVTKTGKEIIESLEKDEGDVATNWAEEYKTQEENEMSRDDDDYLNSIPDITDSDVKYWEKLQEDFNELFNQEQLLNQEEFSVQSTLNDKNYSFERDNPFNGYQNSFEEGLKKLEAGDLISAILLFEEAVTQQPDHAEAWQYLGTSQAENEQELLSIKALNKCVELQPDNLKAWMALSVSYTNESQYFQACEALKSWITNNPKYSHLIKDQVTGPSAARSSFPSSLVSSDTINQVENLYLTAARISPQQTIDPEIQIGLGVLFNIAHEYDKAIDCFKTGLQVNPESALLWNKLGATLANSGRSAEAVEAYRNALSLRPGFIRCRYNLGISCINLKVYGTALDHFLTALNMQRQGEDPSRAASTMSENIWDTLRMTMSLHGRLDLLKAVESRDLERLSREFQSEPVASS